MKTMTLTEFISQMEKEDKEEEMAYIQKTWGDNIFGRIRRFFSVPLVGFTPIQRLYMRGLLEIK